MGTYRFAIIDDDPDTRIIMHDMLAPGASIDLYADGAAALTGMPQRVPDLVMIDMSLPDADGIEVLRKMRGEVALAAIPALIVTAHAMVGDRERFLAAGFQGYVAKPIDEEGLQRLIRELLGDSRLFR